MARQYAGRDDDTADDAPERVAPDVGELREPAAIEDLQRLDRCREEEADRERLERDTRDAARAAEQRPADAEWSEHDEVLHEIAIDLDVAVRISVVEPPVDAVEAREGEVKAKRPQRDDERGRQRAEHEHETDRSPRQHHARIERRARRSIRPRNKYIRTSITALELLH